MRNDAAVAHLEELGHGQGAGLAEAVEDPTGDADPDEDDGVDHLPPAEVEARDVVHLEHADDRDGAERGRPLRHADEIAAARPSRGQEVRDRTHEALRDDRTRARMKPKTTTTMPQSRTVRFTFEIAFSGESRTLRPSAAVYLKLILFFATPPNFESTWNSTQPSPPSVFTKQPNF